MHKTDQEGLKYQKLYNWAHTLITSGIIKNMDKFPSETSLQKKFGYSRQTVRTALQQLEEEGLITRVRGSGTYVSYDSNGVNGERPQIGLLLSYYSDYLFPRVYDGIEASLAEKGYGIEVAETLIKCRDNLEQHTLNHEIRAENIIGVYKPIDKINLQGKRILLIDDIVTTGYTLSECCRILSENNDIDITCATVATAF